MESLAFCATYEQAKDVLHEMIQYIIDYNSCYQLMQEVKYGYTHHQKTIKRAQTFFGMAERCFYINILNNLHRIYSVDKDSIGIARVLSAIKKNVYSYSELKKDEQNEVVAIVNDLKKEHKSLSPLVEDLRILRNKQLAHFDLEYFLENDKLHSEINLTYGDLKKLMDFADNACRLLYCRITHEDYLTCLIHTDDIRKIYKAVDGYYNIPIAERLEYKSKEIKKPDNF